MALNSALDWAKNHKSDFTAVFVIQSFDVFQLGQVGAAICLNESNEKNFLVFAIIS
jgi:hypothetical protein